MKEVGLIPSDTGQPGGKETGMLVSHYIDPAGPFARLCAEIIDCGFEVPYVERWGDQEARKKKAASTRPGTPARPAA
ncbi:MAG: hypothetical protein SV201_09650 [Pseudomonadota bacterium]|nr:hypothetical protein [Pseudomonadota bacterium]